MNKPDSKITKVTASSSQDEEFQALSSPVIVPSMVRTVSYNVFDFEEPELIHRHSAPPRKPATAAELEFIDSARSFLLGIANEGSSCSEQCAAASSLSVEHWVSSSGREHVSYQSCLQAKKLVPRMIDLSEYCGRISHTPLKEEMNNEFAAKYPRLGKLTLSRLLTIRERIYKLSNYFDPCIIAFGWYYFMKLLSTHCIRDSSPKLFAAACVLLAYKFYEETHLHVSEQQLEDLIRRLRRLVQKESHQLKDLMKAEFEVYALLRFSLLANFRQVAEYFAEAQQRVRMSRQVSSHF